MGAKAETTLQVGGRRYAGTALLETDELLFRGETRLRIGLGDVRDVSATDGMLRVEHSNGVALFSLGPAATKWAEKIQHPRTLAEKLGVTRGMRVSLLGIDDVGVREHLAASGAVLVSDAVSPGTPMVIVRVATASGLGILSGLAAAMARDGAIWVVHPRGDPAVADTVIFAAARTAGLTYVKVLRFSNSDSAEKLVIPRAMR